MLYITLGVGIYAVMLLCIDGIVFVVVVVTKKKKYSYNYFDF